MMVGDRSKKSDAFRDILRIIGRGRKLQRDLTADEAREAMRLMLSDRVSDAQIGAFLVTMRVKEETAEEISGFIQGVRDVMQPFPDVKVEGLVDIALPYNGKTRNLQTGVAVGLVLASAGVPVLLHGADHIPTKHGIAVLNLLRTLGYPADNPPELVKMALEECNFGVLNIEHVLPQWTALTPLRHHFGVRTLMNTVEKLINPANAPYHVSGFYHSSYLARMATCLPAPISSYLARMATCLPAPISWIVQGDEGSIDVRPGKKTRIYKAVATGMNEIMLDAGVLGFPDEVDLSTPADPNSHATQIREALNGERNDAFEQIALTSGVMLHMLERVPDYQTGIELAINQLKSGRAMSVLSNASRLRNSPNMKRE